MSYSPLFLLCIFGLHNTNPQKKMQKAQTVFDNLGDLAEIAEDVLADGRITGMETMSMAVTVPGKVTSIVMAAPGAVEEIINSTPEEKAALINNFKQRFELDNDQAEQLVEEVLQSVVAVYNSIEAVLNQIRALAKAKS